MDIWTWILPFISIVLSMRIIGGVYFSSPSGYFYAKSRRDNNVLFWLKKIFRTCCVLPDLFACFNSRSTYANSILTNRTALLAFQSIQKCISFFSSVNFLNVCFYFHYSPHLLKMNNIMKNWHNKFAMAIWKQKKKCIKKSVSYSTDSMVILI